MRGAITLFLLWLFWKAGGMDWDSSDPITLIDTGGIAFLRRLALSPGTGWDNIGTAYGKPVESLFREMIAEINRARKAGLVYEYPQDPLTGEAAAFFANMGELGGVYAGFPQTYTTSAATALGHWSFALFDTVTVSDDSIGIIKGK